MAKARADLQRLVDEAGDADRPAGTDNVGCSNAGHQDELTSAAETRHENEQSQPQLHEPQATAKLSEAGHDGHDNGDDESTIDSSLPMNTKENNVRRPSRPEELPAKNDTTPLRDSPPPKAASGAQKNTQIAAKRVVPPGSGMTASATFSTNTTPQQSNHGKKRHPKKKSSFEAELRDEFSVIQSPYSSRCNSARQDESTNVRANESSKQLPPAQEYARADDQSSEVHPTKKPGTDSAKTLPSKKPRDARKSEGPIKSATRKLASSTPRQSAPSATTSKSAKKRAHSATNPSRSPRRSKRLKETARAEQAPKAAAATERSGVQTQITKDKSDDVAREEDAKPSQPTPKGKPRAPSESFDLDSNDETCFDPLLGTQVTFADAADRAEAVPGLDESEAYEEAPKPKHLSIFGGRLGGWASGKSRARKKKRMMTKKKKRSSAAIELDFDIN